MPSLTWKMEYRQQTYQRYSKADKREKSKILDEFMANCGYKNRKYAIRIMNAPPAGKTAPARKRLGHILYQPRTIDIAEAIWKASGYLCGARLKEAIPLWLPSVKKRFHPAPQIIKELLSISSRQLDNRLAERKRRFKKRIYGVTRPGYLLKAMIPIRTSNWDIKLPGYLEIDLVAHCGNSNEGQYIYTLDSTDIQTGWVERVAVMGKGKTGVLNGVFDIKRNLPIRLRGVDSDNGDEFINYQLLDFCKKSRPPIEFTRGRAYKKNDNAYIEQKNRTHVRQIFGWDRYESQEALEAMNDLYDNELRILQNLFQPSMKLKDKIQIGSKWIRKYDQPKTPFQRVVESGKYNKAKVKNLKGLLKTLDPFELSLAVDQKLEKIFAMASERIQAQKGFEAIQNQAIKKPSSSSWRKFRFSKRYAKQHKIMSRLKRELALSA